MARAVYFLPRAQSVPTVRSRRPERFKPDAIGIPAGGVRTSNSRRLYLSAADCKPGRLDSRMCMPDTRSSPASRASRSAPYQLGGMWPPALATPITMLRAPRAAAALGSRLRQPQRDTRSRQGVLADATIPRPIAQAERRLGETRLGDIAEEQKIRLRQHEPGDGDGLFPGCGRRIAASIRTPRSPSHHRIADGSRRWRWRRSACCRLRPRSCLHRW